MHQQAIDALVAVGLPGDYAELVGTGPVLIYRSKGDPSPTFSLAAASTARAARIPTFKVEVPLANMPAWSCQRSLTQEEADGLKAALTAAGERYVTDPLSV